MALWMAASDMLVSNTITFGPSDGFAARTAGTAAPSPSVNTMASAAPPRAINERKDTAATPGSVLGFLATKSSPPPNPIPYRISGNKARKARLPTVATRETRQERGRRRGDDVLRRLVNELRTARQVAGLSQRAVAVDAGWTQSELHRLESHEFTNVSLSRLGVVASVLGLEISVGVHPIGDGLRDKGHEALLKRFAAGIHPSLRQTREAPFPNSFDRRSWDMLLGVEQQLVGVEAETRIRDIQELVRRVRQRERDGGVDEIVIVLANSAHNRALVGDLRLALGKSYSTSPVGLRRALREGRIVPGSGVILA